MQGQVCCTSSDNAKPNF